MAPSTNPVRSRIRTAIVYALNNRITGSTAIRYSSGGNTTVDSTGYYLSIKRAYDPPVHIEKMNEFPTCNVILEDDICDNASNTQIDQNQGRLHNYFRLRIDCFLNDINDPALTQDKILADIQKYFGINYTIPDSNGIATAFNCYYERSEPFGLETNTPNCGITIYYLVWYTQKLIDPTTF